MHIYDVVSLLCLLGIAALLGCIAYAIRDADNPDDVLRERPSATWGPGYDPDLLPVDPYQPDQQAGNH